MDNFEAHICIEAINLAKENGVTILTVPPHSTGKLQPLDVAIFRPFKVAYRNIFTDLDFAPSEVTDREQEQPIHLADNAPKLMQQRGDPHIEINEASVETITEAIPETSQLQHICASDRSQDSSPSISNPENPKTSSTVTNSPSKHLHSKTPSPLSTPGPSKDQQSMTPLPKKCDLPSETPLAATSSGLFIDLESREPPLATNLGPSKSLKSKTPSPVIKLGGSKDFIGPFEFRGLPKAGARKSGRASRRKGKSMVATDTPNILEIENRHKEKEIKQRKKEINIQKRKLLQSESSDDGVVAKCHKVNKHKLKKRGPNKKFKQIQPESSEEESDNMSLHSELEDYEEEKEDLFIC